MSGHTSTSTHTAPLRGVRVGVFAALAAGIGGAGHAAVVGTSADLRIMLASFIAIFAYGWIFANERHSARVLVPALMVMQGLVHVASMVAHTPAAHSAHMHHSADVGGGWHPTLLMLAVHVLATLVGSIILLRLERHAWRSIVTVGRAAVRFFTRSTQFPRVCSAPAPLQLAVSSRETVWTVAWLTTSCGRRGPPLMQH